MYLCTSFRKLFFMKREEIIKITTEVLVEEFEVEPSVIQDKADFRESLALDSLDYVDLQL